MTVPGFAPGDVIAEKYRVERTVAQGGMGLIVAARHTTLEKQVAIKCLVRPEGLLPEEAVSRFTREARAAASIESDHVCRVFDVGVVGSTPYMVMELLEGHDLEVELTTRGKLPVTEAVDFVLQALDGINAAHALGIVHRDLKPANLFVALRPDGSRRVKVLDFGISKVEGRDAKLTDTQGSFGTPLYMSPEQVKNAKHTDLRTDIWALGAILHELVAGQPPFAGETSGEVLAAVLEGAPTALDVLVPSVPAPLAEAVTRCLTRDRDARFSSARELALALAPFGSGRIAATRAIVPRPPSSSTAGVLSAPTMSESHPLATVGSGWTTGRTQRSRRAVGIVVAGCALALVGAVAFGWARARSSSGASAVTPPPAPFSAGGASSIGSATTIDPAPTSATSPQLAAPAAEPAIASSSAARTTGAAKAAKATPAPRAPTPAKTDSKRSASDILKDSY